MFVSHLDGGLAVGRRVVGARSRFISRHSNNALSSNHARLCTCAVITKGLTGRTLSRERTHRCKGCSGASRT
eukprot:7049817-Pyramimonas_sp.AAC.1